MGVASGAGCAAAAARRSPSGSRKSSATTQTRVLPRRLARQLDGVLFGHHARRRRRPARAGWRSRGGRAGAGRRSPARPRAACRRSAAAPAMPAAASSGRPRSAASACGVAATPRHQSAQRRRAGQRALRAGARPGGAGLRRVVEHMAVDRHVARQRLAQRPGRQQQAVADAALVEHDHLHVARQCAGAAGRRRRPGRPPRDGRRSKARAASMRRVATQTGARVRRRISSGSSPTVGGQAVVEHLARRGAVAAVAARDHARRAAGAAQRLDQRDHGRRLAGAAGDQVADHDHRHRRPLGSTPADGIGCAARAGYRGVTPRQRPQAAARATMLQLATTAGRGRPRCDRPAPRSGRGLGFAALRGEGQARQAGAARGVEHVDHRLVRGHRVGRDDEHGVAAAGGGGRQLGGQQLDAAPVDGAAVDRVAAVGGDGDDDLARPLAQRLRVGRRAA